MENVKYLSLDHIIGTTEAIITTAFKQKCVPGKPWSSGWHNGVDIACKANTPIYAAADGVVVNVDSEKHNDGFGNRCIIKHPDGRATVYAHMADIAIVKVGDKVERGQFIGRVGSTGRSTGPHVHVTLLDRYDENPNIYYKGFVLDPAIIMGTGSLKWSASAKPITVFETVTNKVESNVSASNIKPKFEIGDIVDFHGDTHYGGSNELTGYPCKPGKAKITNINKQGVHPYHLINDGTGSTVYGWVNEDDIVPKIGKTVEELANEVIAGKWGNGIERKRRLEEAGYDYHKVQKRVNELLYK